MARSQKPSGWQVYVYDPAVGRKVYIKPKDFGFTTPLNERQARDLERRAILHYKKGNKAVDAALTVREYAEDWLEHHHGEGTRRPSPATYKQSEWKLREFLDEFGDRPIDGGIGRKEALRWARAHEIKAQVASAMFNDALDDEETRGNPFANRRAKQPRGRRDISPLTEREVVRLGEIAEAGFGDFGKVVRAIIVFSAWVGTRPSETFAVKWSDLNMRDGMVTVTRVKGYKQTERVILPKRVQDALREMPRQAGDRVFSTVRGHQFSAKNWGWYWPRVRDAFMLELTADRRSELLSGRHDFDFYELRHFCASQIVAQGGNEYDCAFQLGNSPEECRKTYIHDYKERRLETIRQALDGGKVTTLKAVRRG